MVSITKDQFMGTLTSTAYYNTQPELLGDRDNCDIQLWIEQAEI